MAIQVGNLDKYEVNRTNDQDHTEVLDNFETYYGNTYYGYRSVNYRSITPESSPVVTSSDNKYYISAGEFEGRADRNPLYDDIYVNRKSDNQTAFTLSVPAYGQEDMASTSTRHDFRTICLCKISQDIDYDYYLLSAAETVDFSIVGSGTLVLRILKNVEFFENSFFELPPLSNPPTGFSGFGKWISFNKDTLTWHSNESGELGITWPVYKNFDNEIIDISRSNCDFVGNYLTENALIVFQSSYIVEKYVYDISTNELSKVATLNILDFGVIHNHVYDYYLDLAYFLVWNEAQELYRILVVEPEKLSVWAIGGYSSLKKNGHRTVDGGISNKDFRIVGMTVLHGSIAITTTEIGVESGSFRGTVVWFAKKRNLLIEEKHVLGTIDNYNDLNISDSYQRYQAQDSVYANSRPNFCVDLNKSSFRYLSSFHVFNIGSSSGPGFQYFSVGVIAFNSEILTLTDELPKNSTNGLIFLLPNVGATSIGGDLLTMTINPEAWGALHQIDFSFNGVMSSSVAKLQEDVLFDISANMEWMTIDLSFGLEMSAGVNCIDSHEIDSSIFADIVGTAVPLTIGMHDSFSEVFNDTFNLRGISFIPSFELYSLTGARVDSIELPALTGLSSSYPGYILTSDIELPSMELNSQTGFDTESELPSLTLDSFVIPGVVSSTEIPELFNNFVFDSSATTGLVMSFAESLPAIIVTGTSISSESAVVLSDTPQLKLSSSMIPGVVCNINSSLTSVQALSGISSSNNININSELPTFVVRSNILFSGEDSPLVFDRWDSDVV